MQARSVTDQDAAIPTLVQAGSLVPQNRPVNGRFLPGNNANPGGRPKGFGALVRQRTSDGADLVEVALEILHAKRKPIKYRLQALEWLADRGWGKAVQAHEVTGEDGGAITFTLRLGERDADRDD